MREGQQLLIPSLTQLKLHMKSEYGDRKSAVIQYWSFGQMTSLQPMLCRETPENKQILSHYQGMCILEESPHCGKQCWEQKYMSKQEGMGQDQPSGRCSSPDGRGPGKRTRGTHTPSLYKSNITSVPRLLTGSVKKQHYI